MMKIFICILALALTVEAGLLPHGHIDEIAPHYDAVHGDVHISQSPAIVIEENGVSIAAADIHHHHDHHHDVHVPATKIVHHESIHQVEPVHHVTKVVHHEPHHFVHYTKPVVDHHYQREVAHVHSAPVVLHHGHHADYYSHAAPHVAYYSALSKHLHHHYPYSKLRVTEKHY